jgi:hypothetical protein
MTDALERLAERLPEVKAYRDEPYIDFDDGGTGSRYVVKIVADAALAACANKFAAVVILIDEYEQENARLKTELEATEGAFELRKQIDSDLVWELRRRAEQAEAELENVLLTDAAVKRIAELEAELAALRARTEQALVDVYCMGMKEAVVVGRLCDDSLDRSGAMLGRIREKARAAREEASDG